MESPCYKCGGAIDEGKPFCPHCLAPLIRVALPGASTPEPPPAGEIPLAEIPHNAPAIRLPGKVDWSQGRIAALFAASMAALFGFAGIGPLFAGIGVMAAGGFAVSFYRRRVPGVEVTPGMGAKLGAATGTIGFTLLSVIAGIKVALTGVEKFHAALLDNYQHYQMQGLADPQAQQQFLEVLKTPAGFALVLLLGLGCLMIIFVALASVGGAATALVTRRR
ncbi:MAG TPA: hypothetical protein VGF06_02175 [Terriglobales bacterium]